LGLYFYPKISSNKWLIKTINIHDYEDNYDNCWSRQEIESDWENDIQEINNNISNEIKRLENLNMKINELFKEIKDMKNTDNIWENKLNELKSIIISPNNRILSIYDNR
jgi:chromosome segregation ATPase